MADLPPPDPNSKKLTGNPDINVFVESTTAPLKAVRLRTRGPVDADANLILCFDPSTGMFASPQIVNFSTGSAEARRAITSIKTTGASLILAAGDNSTWAPAAGKKVRLKMIDVVVDGLTTTTAGSLITLKDITGASTVMILESLDIVAPGGVIKHNIQIPDNGYLFPSGHTIGINISAVLNAGGISVTLWGNEE